VPLETREALSVTASTCLVVLLNLVVGTEIEHRFASKGAARLLRAPSSNDDTGQDDRFR